MAVSTDPNDPNFGLETDQSSPDFGLPAQKTPQEGGLVSSVVSEAKSLGGQALGLLNPIHLLQGALDIQPRSGLQEVMRTGRLLKDIVGGTPVGEAIQKEAPEVYEQQQAILGKYGQKAQRETLRGIGTQLGMVAAPFVHGKITPLREIAGLEKPVAPEAMPQTPEPPISETVPPITEEPFVHQGVTMADAQVHGPEGVRNIQEKLGISREEAVARQAAARRVFGISREIGVETQPAPNTGTLFTPEYYTALDELEKVMVENAQRGATKPEKVQKGEFGKKGYTALPTEEVIPSASEITSPESVTQPEVRPRVGEEAPLRQQGETAAAREEVVPTEEVAPTVPQPEQPIESISAAAIKYSDGSIETGTTHAEISGGGAVSRGAEDGFVTNTGRFVDAKEAHQIAIASKQLPSTQKGPVLAEDFPRDAEGNIEQPPSQIPKAGEQLPQVIDRNFVENPDFIDRGEFQDRLAEKVRSSLDEGESVTLKTNTNEDVNITSVKGNRLVDQDGVEWGTGHILSDDTGHYNLSISKPPPIPKAEAATTAAPQPKTETPAETVPPKPPVETPAAEAPITPQKPSKIGKSIETKAVEAKLTEGFSETAGYDPIQIADQAERATAFVRDFPEDARAVVRGDATLPEGLHGTSLITAMEEQLLRKPDAKLAYELANSPLTSATSVAAQELRLMGERVPDSIAAKFKEIRDARREGSKLRGETPESLFQEIGKEIVRQSSKRPTWEAFVRSIECV